MNNMTEDKFTTIEANSVIELKSASKTAKQIVQPAWNATIGWWAGVPRLSEDDKKKLDFWVDEKSKMVLKDGITFNLSNPIDKANWEWIRYCKQVAASVDDLLHSPEAMFYVHIEGREAKQKNSRSIAKFEAQKFVIDDAMENYASRCLLLGMDFEGESPEVMREFLLEKAMETPEDVKRIYTSKNLSIHLLYLTAKKKSLIKESRGVMMYDHHILGVNDEAAIAYLQDPDSKGIVELLERATKPEYFTEKKTTAKETVAENTSDDGEVEEPKKKFGFQKK